MASQWNWSQAVDPLNWPRILGQILAGAILPNDYFAVAIQGCVDHALIVGVTDVKGTIINANARFCEISKFEMNELLGQNHRILNSGYHPRSFFGEMYRRIARGDVWRGEICNRAKDGGIYWVDTTIVPTCGANGKPIYYTSVRVDITARKMAEQSLRHFERLAGIRAWHLETTLAHMSQGIIMVDPNGLVVVTNEKAIQLLALTPALAATGESFAGIFRHLLLHGAFSFPQSSTPPAERPDVGCGEQELHQVEQVKDYDRADGLIVEIRTARMSDGSAVHTFTDVTERRLNERRAIHMALHDTLTGLGNRALLDERLDRAIGLSRCRAGQFALLLLDLDGFKMINDTYGHPVGDRVLKRVADRISTCVRRGDAVARTGGDEFAVLQTLDPERPDAAARLAKRLLEAIDSTLEVDGHHFHVTTSIGIVLTTPWTADRDALIKGADAALYAAKSSGRNAFRFAVDDWEGGRLEAHDVRTSAMGHARETA